MNNNFINVVNLIKNFDDQSVIKNISFNVKKNSIVGILGKNGAGKVLLRSAPAGTGIIAGGPVRAICEMSGIQDVVGKSIGSSNPYNLVRASFDALIKQKSPKEISLIRGKKIKDIVSRR